MQIYKAASPLAANGVPIVTAAALLGHDPMVYAKTYAHHYAEDLRKASEILSGLYSGKRIRVANPFAPCYTGIRQADGSYRGGGYNQGSSILDNTAQA